MPEIRNMSRRRMQLIEAVRATLGKRHVVFVGMMGSGKSAIGRLIADDLQLPYFDSDHEIVSAAGLSIPEIFERFGEEYFRAGERRVITRLLGEGASVVSLGGGAFLSPETRQMIAQRGVTCWLTADVDLLLARVMRRPGTRPLLQTDDPRATLVDLLARREPVYRLADLHVASSRISKRQTGDAVLSALAPWLAARRTPASAGS
jgi:shikimate kinase